MSKKTCAILVVACALASGCSKADPPCSPGALSVAEQEADEGLARKAGREAKAGRGKDIAAAFNCGHAPGGDGVYKQIGQSSLDFIDVLYCLQHGMSGGVSLSLCMEGLARSKFANSIAPKGSTMSQAVDIAEKVDCTEASRSVDVSADDHGLTRTGADAWVEVALGAAVLADRMKSPATAAAMFVIQLAAGQEQTCFDTPRGPSAGCLNTDGCGGAPPGATVPGGSAGSGDVIQPGTDPGTPGGDHP